MEIIIDSREPTWVKELIPSYFEERVQEKFTFKTEELPAGDIRCGDLLIERKEINDFYNSIVESRMTLQKMKLVMAMEEGLHPYVLIHGDINDVFMNNLTKRSYCGMIASLNEHGVHTIQLQDSNLTMICETIYALIRKHNEDKPLKPVWIEPDGSTWCEKSLRCIPNIGEATAHNIIGKFPTLHSMMECSKESMIQGLMEIDGIGEKTATHIYDVVNEGWK